MATGEMMAQPLENAAVNLPPEMMLMKMENEQIMAVAMKQGGRDYGKIKEQLFSVVDEFPESAAEAIYSKPVGSVIVITCKCGHTFEVTYIGKEGEECERCQEKTHYRDGNRWQKKKKFARNLSVRSAESIRNAYGFNRVAVNVAPVDSKTYKVTATFVDYATGNVTIDEKLVSQFYTNRRKEQVKHPEDRFFDVILEGSKSKCRRNAILQGVPGQLKAAYREYCEKKISGLLDDSTVQKMIANFGNKGITQEMLEKFIGKTVAMGWTIEDRKTALGIWQSLESEETTVAELMAEIEEAQPSDEGESEPDTPQNAVDTSKSQALADEAKRKRTAKKKPSKKKADDEEKPEAKPVEQTKPEWGDGYVDSLAKCKTKEELDSCRKAALEQEDGDRWKNWTNANYQQALQKLKAQGQTELDMQ